MAKSSLLTILLIVVAIPAASVFAADALLDELLQTFRNEFVAIAPGEAKFPAEFTRGRHDGPANERPAAKVRMTRAFAIAKYEVPQNLWEAVMGSNPSRWQGPRNSVEEVAWDDCQAFCKRVTELLRAKKLIAAKQVVRLPTEAEWEYCARAGTTTLYSFGDNAAQLGDFGWFTGNAAGNDPPVGAKGANPWGLYDLHGYLWEWCADAWHADYSDAPPDGSAAEVQADPQVPAPPPRQYVLRGGSWKDAADQLTSTARRGAEANFKDDAVGLRCVLAAE